jgi:hypothetical protein
MTKNTKGGVMKVKGSRRLVARLGLALAVAAIAVPSASAVTMNGMYESGGSGGGVRLYADDLHAPLVSTSLPPSNVRTDSATVPISLRASNVRTDAATVRFSVPASNVRTDAASFRGPSPITNDRHVALLRRDAQLGQEPTQLASASSGNGIDWSVAGFGAVLGAFGLMLLIGVVYFTGRHHRRSRLAAA